MSGTLPPPLVLDEILASVHEELETGASGARVRQIADANPGVRDDILAFAAEWSASLGSDLADDELEVTRTAREHHLILERFWAAAASQDAKPFDGLPVGRLGDIAARCRIDTDILRQIVRGKVDEMSIPAKLVGWLSAELDIPQQAVWASLASAEKAAYADFFAPGGLKQARKMRFADVVRESALDDVDKRFWLEPLEP
ncbi:hypothetical protein [Acidisphaera sp. L21]|uniref:hypothetical protein n=1 Tax=Acidisphaera sp. L21 TaxID=1641851 RepID=UPI00131E8653|nr:hypothetical protein [Acidisphaera sp. L21]